MNAGTPTGYEPGIDGLRAVSIAGVLLFHACATSSLSGWFRGGGLGVSVFFTLSGFLITSLLVREIDQHGRVDLGRFWSRRIRRLAPAALSSIVAVVLVARTTWLDVRSPDVTAAVWSATNWRVIGAGQHRLLETIVGPLGPTWSLAVEEQFYVVLALLAAAVSWTARPARSLAIIFGVTVPLSVLLANVVSDWSPRLEFGTDLRAAEIAIGGLLALAIRRWRPRLEGHRRSADLVGTMAIGALAVLFLVADYTPPWLLRGGFSIVAVITCAVLVGVLAHGRLDAVLATRPLVALGKASYSLYLVHWPVILVMTPARTGIDGWGLVAAKAAVALVLAVVVHVAIEQPIRSRTDVSARITFLVWLGASAGVTALGYALAA